jgi:hypothetical protein
VPAVKKQISNEIREGVLSRCGSKQSEHERSRKQRSHLQQTYGE